MLQRDRKISINQFSCLVSPKSTFPNNVFKGNKSNKTSFRKTSYRVYSLSEMTRPRMNYTRHPRKTMHPSESQHDQSLKACKILKTAIPSVTRISYIGMQRFMNWKWLSFHWPFTCQAAGSFTFRLLLEHHYLEQIVLTVEKTDKIQNGSKLTNKAYMLQYCTLQQAL